MELDLKYVDVIIERWETSTGQKESSKTIRKEVGDGKRAELNTK
jgi:hypothetical protein